MGKIVQVNKQNVNYLKGGESSDTAMVFMHGVPFNANLWAPVMEKLTDNISTYSLDLKGFGSNIDPYMLDKDEYSLNKQIDWLELCLKCIPAERFIFIMHGWSSVPGTMIAQRMQEKVLGLAYFEAQIRPVVSPDMLSLPMQTIANSVLNNPDVEDWILNKNSYHELFFSLASMGDTKDLHDLFDEQFEEIACRYAILQYLYEIPFGFKRSRIVESIEMNSIFLQRSNIPKCLFYSTPGFMTTMSTISWAKQNFKEISLVDLGHAMHCAPLTVTKKFAAEITNWAGSLAHKLPDQ